jgi:transitional endoplasmic reticulum ATPase
MPSLADREGILSVSARKLRTDPELPHHHVASMTDGWSPAELSAIWTEAALLAATDIRDQIIIEDYIGGFERVARQRQQSHRGTQK